MSYKDSKEKSYGMKDMGVMGHATKTYKCDAFAAQKSDLGRLDKRPMDYRGTPKQAFGYEY